MHTALIVWLAIMAFLTIVSAGYASKPGPRFFGFAVALVHLFFMAALVIGTI
jgi:hypothetical protein